MINAFLSGFFYVHQKEIQGQQDNMHVYVIYLGIKPLITVNKVEDESVNYSQDRYSVICGVKGILILTKIECKTTNIPIKPRARFEGGDAASNNYLTDETSAAYIAKGKDCCFKMS